MAMTTPGPKAKSPKELFEEGVDNVIEVLTADGLVTRKQAEALVYTQIIMDLKTVR